MEILSLHFLPDSVELPINKNNKPSRDEVRNVNWMLKFVARVKLSTKYRGESVFAVSPIEIQVEDIGSYQIVPRKNR